MSIKFSKPLNIVRDGQVINIIGKTEKPERFDIDFSSGDSVEWDSGDVILHLSVRFYEGCWEIVRNTHDHYAGWGIEERGQNMFRGNLPNPVVPGGEFMFTFKVEEMKFVISIDGKPFCTYPHRKPLCNIKRINIHGDVSEMICITQAQQSQCTKSKKYQKKCVLL
jgi:hypothetical protein